MAIPKAKRIKRDKDFERVFKTGRALKHPFFLLKFSKNNFPYCRAAVSAPMSLSKKAVTRHKVKRIFWAALGEVFSRCRPGVDLVIIISPGAIDKNVYQITGSLEEIFIKANIVQK